MAGIYIHIPFCKSLCNYCDFYSSISLAKKGLILEAIKDELAQRAGFLSDRKIQSIYIGGGTPSLCDSSEIESLISRVREIYDCSEVAEVTMEANPDDLSLEYLCAIARSGVGRLSIGIQSFIDRDLTWMNRRHSSHTAREAVATAREAGFSNITIDLIYGIPGMSIEEWGYNLREATKLNVEHISAYHLTIEPRTRFGKLAQKGLLTEVDQEFSVLESELMQKILNEAGYEQYEISNFSKPGFNALHNSNYWNGTQYLGVGPSAHSYNGTQRDWNVSSNTAYLRNKKNNTQFESELLTENIKYNEYVMTSLRTSKGIDIKRLEELFGAQKLQYFLDQVQKQLSLGLIIHNKTQYYIPQNRFIVSDGIISDLFT